MGHKLLEFHPTCLAEMALDQTLWIVSLGFHWKTFPYCAAVLWMVLDRPLLTSLIEQNEVFLGPT